MRTKVFVAANQDEGQHGNDVLRSARQPFSVLPQERCADKRRVTGCGMVAESDMLLSAREGTLRTQRLTL